METAAGGSLPWRAGWKCTGTKSCCSRAGAQHATAARRKGKAGFPRLELPAGPSASLPVPSPALLAAPGWCSLRIYAAHSPQGGRDEKRWAEETADSMEMGLGRRLQKSHSGLQLWTGTPAVTLGCPRLTLCLAIFLRLCFAKQPGRRVEMLLL